MDKNGKLFGKISIVDLIVLLLVLAVAAGSVWRFTSPSAALNQDNATIDFTIRIDGVRDFTLENYNLENYPNGMRIYDRQAGQFIGHIRYVRYTDFYESHPLHDGTIVWAAVPGRVTLYLDIVANGRVTPTAVFVEGTYEIGVGSLRYINTKYVQTSGTIHSIDIR
ncbi:MAG: DUF4330 domain-containing protein [Defluviitaleaceae bacterium]|nr:DUF4330 domain-containing protein [Defluviitaleaceae bacterium]